MTQWVYLFRFYKNNYTCILIFQVRSSFNIVFLLHIIFSSQDIIYHIVIWIFKNNSLTLLKEKYFHFITLYNNIIIYIIILH